MIKSLAVYGDSFGTYSLSGNQLFRQKGMSYHWVSLLKKEYNCEVTNYSLSGSSVYYSYQKFLETFNQHDTIIFLVTEPSRYLKPLDFSFSSNACITNEAHIEMWRKTRKNYTQDDLELLEKLSHWFQLTDLDYSYDMSELMIEKVMSENKNIIIFPCYEISMRDNFRKKHNFSEKVNLCSLYYKQMEELKLSDDGMNTNWVENCEYISGHLTPEYNQVAYENISFYLKNKYWNWNIPNVSIIDKSMKDNYYNKL